MRKHSVQQLKQKLFGLTCTKIPLEILKISVSQKQKLPNMFFVASIQNEEFLYLRTTQII